MGAVVDGLVIGDLVVGGVANHLPGDIVTEFRHLFSDVPEEGVTGPAPEQHDSIDRYLIKVHSHRCRRPNRMKADIRRSNTKFRLDGIDKSSKELQSRSTGNTTCNALGIQIRVQKCVRIRAEGTETANNSSSRQDRTT